MMRRTLPHLLTFGVILIIANAACNHARPAIHQAAPTTVPAAAAPAPASRRDQVTAAELAALMDLVKNPQLEMRLRIEACWQLGNLREDAAPVTPELLALTTNDILRPHILGTLRAIGPPTAPTLVEAIASSSMPVRSAAATLLWDMGPGARGAIPGLTRLAANGEQEARLFAIDLLDGLAPYAASAEETLNKLQRDDNPYIAIRAMSAVERIRATANGRWVPAPMSEAEYRRRVAALNVGRPPLPHPAVADTARPDIEAMTEHVKSEEIKRLASLLLRGRPQDQQDALDWLKRYAAIRPDARAALLEAVKSGDPSIRRDAALGLAMLGLERQAVTPVLEAALEQESVETQMLTAYALTKVDPNNPKLIPVALQALATPLESVKFQALYVLSQAAKRPPDAARIVSKYVLDPDYRTRDLAVHIVEADGPEISAEIRLIAKHIADAPEREVELAQQLKKLGDRALPIVPRLLALTQDGDLASRSAALFILSQIYPSHPLFEQAIELALNDGAGILAQPGAVEYRAAIALPHPSRRILGPIITLSGNTNAGVAETAMYAVRSFGPAVVEEIENTDLAYDRATVFRIATALAPTVPNAIRVILKGLDDSDPDVRILAVRSFGTLGEIARPHVAALKPLLADRSPAMRSELLNAIAKLGTVAADLSGPIAAQVNEGGDPLNKRATLTLARIAPADPKVVPALVSLIDRSQNAELREEAIDVLLSLDSNDPAYIPAIIKFLDDNDNRLRLQAVNALAKQGSRARAAAGRLSRMVDNEHADVRDAAARALLRVDPDAPALSAAYLATVRHRDSQARTLLTPAVRKLKPEASQKLVPKLNELAANDPDDAVRSDALSALRAIETK